MSVSFEHESDLSEMAPLQRNKLGYKSINNLINAEFYFDRIGKVI